MFLQIVVVKAVCPFVSPGKNRLKPVICSSWLVAGKLLSDGFAPATPVPGFLKWQVLSQAGTNIRFILMEGEAVRDFWHQCGTLSGLVVCCWLTELLGATRVHVLAKLPSHPPWLRQQSLFCKAGCYACKGMGERFEWTLIRNKFEDLQYLSSVRRYTLLGNTSSSSCSDEGQTREKRNSSIQTAALPLSCSPLPSTIYLVLV